LKRYKLHEDRKRTTSIVELCLMQWLHYLLAHWLANERNYINAYSNKNRLMAL